MPIYTHIRILANLLSLYLILAMIINTQEAIYEPPKSRDIKIAAISELSLIEPCSLFLRSHKINFTQFLVSLILLYHILWLYLLIRLLISLLISLLILLLILLL